MAGYLALLSPDQSEIDDLKRRLERVQYRGLLAPIRRLQWIRRDTLPVSQIIIHWRTRPEVRRLIWLGLLFSAITFILVWLTLTSR